MGNPIPFPAPPKEPEFRVEEEGQPALTGGWAIVQGWSEMPDEIPVNALEPGEQAFCRMYRVSNGSLRIARITRIA